MARRQSARTSFWQRSRRGPWPEAVIGRLTRALETIVRAAREEPEVIAVIVFGSYARGDFGRKSDLDLLVLFPGHAQRERTPTAIRIREAISRVETDERLPMHLAPLLVGVEDRATLTNELLHDIWRDGLVLHADASALALLRPEGLTPWAIFRFSVRNSASDRVRLSRRLHGLTKGAGLIQPPALTLGRGAVLVPAAQQDAVRAALDDAGATYDELAIWRAA